MLNLFTKTKDFCKTAYSKSEGYIKAGFFYGAVAIPSLISAGVSLLMKDEESKDSNKDKSVHSKTGIVAVGELICYISTAFLSSMKNWSTYEIINENNNLKESIKNHINNFITENSFTLI